MDEEKIKELADKIKNGTATQEEELVLLKYANQGIEELTALISNIKVEEKK
jgi:hypothetical protein